MTGAQSDVCQAQCAAVAHGEQEGAWPGIWKSLPGECAHAGL